MATATLFQVTVYCCYSNHTATKFHWEAITQIATPSNLRIIPEIVEEDPVSRSNMQTPHHFELLYWELSHFDCIVSHNNSLCLSLPGLSGAEDFMDIDLT